MAFLSVYTPTYKRPVALAACQASLAAQTDPDWEQVVVVDEVGIGIDGMYGAIPLYAHRVTGEWVLVLSDDDLVVDTAFVAGLKRFLAAQPDEPDVVVFKAIKGGRQLPTFWETAPAMGHIDLSNFVVRRAVWAGNADRWGRSYEGDYTFIRALWDQGRRFAWWDRRVVRDQRISRGRPE